MADIFISYSKANMDLAAELAQFLEESGYDVWWDYELVGGFKFRNQIKEQLSLAKAAIVIWTPESVESEFVLDEAEDAKSADKLLPVRVAEVDFKAIPLGFRQFQTELVTKPDLILRALDGLGIAPSQQPVERAPEPMVIAGQEVDPQTQANAEQFANWDFIKESQDPQDFRLYLNRFGDTPFAELASNRLKQLEEQAWIGQVRDSKNPAHVKDFVAKFSDGAFATAAEQLLTEIERDSWSAIDRNDIAALQHHIKSFPNGFSSAQASSRLAELEQSQRETSAWAAIEDAPSRKLIESYLKEFPIGPHANEARELLTSVDRSERCKTHWAAIKQQGFTEQLQSFIAEFGDGPEVEEARTLLAERVRAKELADWECVKEKRHPGPILQFLIDHPEGDFKQEALDLLKALPDLNERESWELISSTDEHVAYTGFALAFPHSEFLRSAVKASMKNATPTAPDLAEAHKAVLVSTPLRNQLLDGWKHRLLILVMAGALVMLGTLSGGRSYTASATALVITGLCAAILLALSWRKIVLNRARALDSDHGMAAVQGHILALAVICLWAFLAPIVNWVTLAGLMISGEVGTKPVLTTLSFGAGWMGLALFGRRMTRSTAAHSQAGLRHPYVVYFSLVALASLIILNVSASLAIERSWYDETPIVAGYGGLAVSAVSIFCALAFARWFRHSHKSNGHEPEIQQRS